jgi:hypothetical protein
LNDKDEKPPERPKPKELTVDKEAIRKAQKENPRKTVRVKSILP